ncbi:hypothetical protein JCM8097_000819 [Rhodosporidiobolus ruineniae]
MARRLRILLVNDDGTPTPDNGHSPFVYGFARALVDQLGADLRVVLPTTQKSWLGKAYLITKEVDGVYYYPRGEDGTEGETRELPKRPEEREEGELEFILLDGTPSTCANIGLHSLFPADSFDLVISGPNFGRNTSTAFALSSGTLGAALAASLSGKKAIAVSYGLMEGYKPPPKEFVDAATTMTCKVIQQLYESGWPEGQSKQDRVDVYSINVPLLPEIVSNPTVQWTTMAQTSYGALFRSTTATQAAGEEKDEGGPAAVPEPKDEKAAQGKGKEDEAVMVKEEHFTTPLRFKFQPDLSALLSPDQADLVEGTDKATLHAGAISVTPIRAAFAEAKPPSGIAAEGRQWKI